MTAGESERRGPDRRQNRNGTPPPGTVIDRRLGLNRRTEDPAPPATQVPGPEKAADGLTGLERRRGPGRRLSDFTKSAEEGEMTTEQFLFLMAIDAFKKSNDRMFPTWTDVLEVIRLLGYRKTQPTELKLPNADDWRERPDAPANVRPQRWAERFTRTDRERTDEALAEFEAQFGASDDLEDAA